MLYLLKSKRNQEVTSLTSITCTKAPNSVYYLKEAKPTHHPLCMLPKIFTSLPTRKFILSLFYCCALCTYSATQTLYNMHKKLPVHGGL